MKTKNLALDLEITMLLSERSDLELASSDFDLVRRQLAECVLADFVDFRGISNPQRWAVGKSVPLIQPLCTYLEDPSYQDPMRNVDDPASTNSISGSDLKDH